MEEKKFLIGDIVKNLPLGNLSLENSCSKPLKAIGLILKNIIQYFLNISSLSIEFDLINQDLFGILKL